MHSYSNEFFVKISKPKISRSPMKVSLLYFPFLAAAGFPLLDSSGPLLTEIEELIFCTIQLKIVP